jgi:hypothetical protein
MARPPDHHAIAHDAVLCPAAHTTVVAVHDRPQRDPPGIGIPPANRVIRPQRAVASVLIHVVDDRVAVGNRAGARLRHHQVEELVTTQGDELVEPAVEFELEEALGQAGDR